MFLRINLAGLFLLAAILGLAGCKKQSDVPQANPIPFTPWTLADSSAKTELPTGVKIYSITEGPGPRVREGSRLCFHYYGTLPGGKKFDSTWERGTPLCFTTGRGELIQGLEEAFLQMRLGTKAVIFVPASRAYGQNVAGSNIPEDSPLIFQVELLGSF